MNNTPTPKTQWVKQGNRCVSPAGWHGEVKRVIRTGTLDYALVLWDRTGQTGRISITHLTKE